MKTKFLNKIIALTSSIILLTTCIPTNLSFKANASEINFGVGEGTKIPDQIFAPYLDFCDYWFDDGFQYNGAPSMRKLYEDTGVKYFNLAFIQAAGKQIVDNKINWAWAGLSALKEGSKDEQYLGMKQSIKEFREVGGEVIVSFGGRDGIALWQATTDETILYNTYKEIVDGYSCTRIDLDIEGGAQGLPENRVNAKAMKMLQAATGVEVTLTLPVLPSGLTQTQLDVLEIYLEEGVDIKLVNIMAMCYSPTGDLNPGESYGEAAVRCVDSTMKQLKEYYKKECGIFLTDAEAYRKVGVTTSIGTESEYYPIFGPDWTKLVTDHAIEKGIGMNSFWSINRDSKQQKNDGIQTPYEHTMVGREFADPNHNFLPEITGVKNKTIQIGSIFNPLSGVKAIDREDGDISSNIVVTGTVNTNRPGNYTLNYSVEDSKGGIATAVRTITVTTEPVYNHLPVIHGAEDKDIILGVPFSPIGGVSVLDEEDEDITYKLSYEGNVDVSKVGTYIIVYSVTDSDGGITKLPMKVNVIEEKDYVPEFDLTKVYTRGMYVWYNGVKYKCIQWTEYVYPDVSSWAWERVPDPVITINDLSNAALLYNSVVGDNKYNIDYDKARNGIIDVYDLSSIAKKITK